MTEIQVLEGNLIEHPCYRAAVRLMNKSKGLSKKKQRDLIQQAASHLAALLCDDPWYSTVVDKTSWVEKRIRSLAGAPGDNWGAAGLAIRKGLADPCLAGAKKRLWVDLPTVVSDLEFVLQQLSAQTTGSRAAAWSGNAILTGLGIVLEARRWHSKELFLSRRSLGSLMDIPPSATRRALESWSPSLIFLKQVGSRYLANTYRLSDALASHVTGHQPRQKTICVGSSGASTLIRMAAEGNRVLEVPLWKRVELRLGDEIEIVRSDGSHRRRFSIPTTSLACHGQLERRPVSWTRASTASGLQVMDEIQAATPYRERLAQTGLPIDQHALQCCIREHQGECTTRGLRVPSVQAEETEVGELLPHELDETDAISDISDDRLLTRLGLLQRLRDRLHADGRSRSHWYDGSATTNRLVSRGDPTTRAVCHQNIPKTLLERIVVAPNGQVIVTADFVSLDPMSLAEMSRDPQLLADIEGDIYELLSHLHSHLFSTTAPLRKPWKSAFLGWCYGAESKRLRKKFDLSPAAAEEVHRILESRYPLATQALERFAEHHHNRGRTFPSVCGFVRAGDRPATVGKSAPVAGTSADICRRFEIEVLTGAAELGMGLDPILSIYDGFGWSIAREDIGTAPRILLEALRRTEQKLALSIPLSLTYGTGKHLLSPSRHLLASTIAST